MFCLNVDITMSYKPVKCVTFKAVSKSHNIKIEPSHLVLIVS